jgi:hypothetical protein
MQDKRLIYLKEHENNESEDDLHVDLTIHDFSANLLKEFSCARPPKQCFYCGFGIVSTCCGALKIP